MQEKSNGEQPLTYKELFKIDYDFKHEFEINKFKESPISIPKDELLAGMYNGVVVSVRGKGERPENKDFVVFRFEEAISAIPLKLRETILPTFVCTCILSILDTEGHKKFPRTFTFVSDSIISDVVEERYIERSCILNGASEFLQDDTITVTVEGTVQQWFHKIMVRMVSHHSGATGSRVVVHESFHILHESFHVEQLDNTLKVYLPKHSEHESHLKEHSKVFQDMWNVPMPEMEEEGILLKNEELPAFLCMLIFIETSRLVLHGATIFDLYKIADKYDIPILLEECRKQIAKYLPKNASAILEFATYYHDTELKKTVESYIEKHSHETRERNDDLEAGDESGDDFVCDTRPVCSNLINTEEDFAELFKNLWDEWHSEITDHAPVLMEMDEKCESFDFYQ